MEWQPIETAPEFPFVKDEWFMSGPRYLLWNGSYAAIGSYGYTKKGAGRWQCSGRVVRPTHWMPLPDAPIK